MVYSLLLHWNLIKLTNIVISLLERWQLTADSSFIAHAQGVESAQHFLCLSLFGVPTFCLLFCIYPCMIINYYYMCVCRVHVKTVHEGRSFPCHLCDHVASYKNNLKRHILSIHTVWSEPEIVYSVLVDTVLVDTVLVYTVLVCTQLLFLYTHVFIHERVGAYVNQLIFLLV